MKVERFIFIRVGRTSIHVNISSMRSDKSVIHIITGHRGTGKTHWLKVISKLYKDSGQEVLCFDLDEVVESFSGQTVCELFKKGERVFEL